MTNLEPLKSAISFLAVDDTSLAMPSANQHRSGQQRVLEQVQTMRMRKSRHFSSTSVSPTNPANDSVFFESSKTQTRTFNGANFGNTISKTLSLDGNMKGASAKGNASVSTVLYQRGCVPTGSMVPGQRKTSHSESNQTWQQSMQKASTASRRLHSTTSTHHKSTNQFKFSTIATSNFQGGHAYGKTELQEGNQFICSPLPISKTSQKLVQAGSEPIQKTKGGSMSNGVCGAADITMKEAVEYLSNSDKDYQRCGASYICHQTFIDDKAKEQVLKLNGILPLVALLRSPSVEVNQTASAALRSLSFKNNNNKEEIHRCSGVTEAVNLLRDTESAEVQKQLTGLLWNLSSLDSLKPDLLQTALPVLMERVILPYTNGSDQAESEAEAFFHTTGCVRNLSSTKQSYRQAMRKCRGLIDSLVRYVEECVQAEKPDHKSVENCVCVLHNLTFQLEAEAPALFSRITSLGKPAIRTNSQDDTGPIGCFSPQAKSPAQKQNFNFLDTEESHPSGAALLIHSKTLQTYLSLLESSQKEETREACCGVLQNLTTNEGVVSAVMSQKIVQKLNGLQVLASLLQSSKINLQRNAMALIGNLSRNPNLHSAIARKGLPEVLKILSAGTMEGNESDDTLALACQAANRVIAGEPEMTKQLLNKSVINSLNQLSQNTYFPKSKKVASLFLYNLWSDKDLQSFLKKQGMSKSSFVNDVTMAANKSVQVVA